MAEDRKQSSLDGFWGTLTEEQIRGTEAVAMDMGDPYISSVRAHVAEADGKIVCDKFHVRSTADVRAKAQQGMADLAAELDTMIVKKPDRKFRFIEE